MERKNEDLLEKVSELEDRSRRNNLRISGIEEKGEEIWEQSEKVVTELLKEKLGLEHSMKIERAHRVGRARHNNGEVNKRRTIVVKFLDYKEKRDVLSTFIQKKLWDRKDLY